MGGGNLPPLTQAQQQAVEKFKRLKVGALFMRMGTGKTRAAVEIVENTDADFVLYLCPCSCKSNVKAELEKWGLSKAYEVVGYETIASSDRTYMRIRNMLEQKDKAFIIADESIFIKSGRSKRKQRAKELRKMCKFALILNGTPIVRNEWDLYHQMDFLSEKIIPYRGYEFLQKFFVEHLFRKGGRECHYYTFYTPNRPVLTKLMAPYVYEAELDFGHDESEHTIWVDCDDSKYCHVRNEIMEAYYMGRDEMFIKLFGALNYQAAVAPEKNKKVAEYISDKQVICFCNFMEEIDQIKSQTDCFVITGETGLKERDRILAEFKLSEKPLLMTMGVGSYSLNLQFCDEIVYSSLTYNFGTLEQSRYRIKRTGQERDIHYTYILGDFGINSLIFENLDCKQSLEEIIKKLIEQQDVSDLEEAS